MNELESMTSFDNFLIQNWVNNLVIEGKVI